MTRTRNIPVVGNTLKRGRKNSKKHSSLTAWIASVGLGFVIMLSIVWLKVETDATIAEIARLEAQLADQAIENNELRSRILKLSSYDRIKNVATALGLDFVGHENLIKIQETN